MCDSKPGEKFHIDIAREFEFEELCRCSRRPSKRAWAERKAYAMTSRSRITLIRCFQSRTAFCDCGTEFAIRHSTSNLDCGWAMNQREYPPVAVYKLNKQLMNLRLCDVNATMREYVAVGQGVMDFKAIVDAVKAVGFTGFMSLEQDGTAENM